MPGYVPGPPHQPTATPRPATWPGSPSRQSVAPSERSPDPDRLADEPLPSTEDYPRTPYPSGDEEPPVVSPAPVPRRPPDSRPQPPRYEETGPRNDAWADPFDDRRFPPRPREPGDRNGYGPPRFQENRPRGPLGPAGANLPRDTAVPCEGAEILARVGPDVILAGEVSMGIAELRAKNKDSVAADVLEEKVRETLKERVHQRVSDKLVCHDIQRTVPADRFTKIKEQYAKLYEQHQIPDMLKKMQLGSRRELEQAFREAGTSLETHKRAFVEQLLAGDWLRQQVKPDEDVSHGQMLAYYREHAAEFERPASAVWEQLTVRPARFSSRQEAYAALAEMGNQVLDGVPFAQVARARSHGPTAAEGGLRERTGQGSLVSKVLDGAIFSLPIGRLSDILEDEQGFHIIRVTERRDASRQPFEEAQVEIKRKIRIQRDGAAKEKYLAKLRSQTPVSTAFDDRPAARSSPLNAIFR